MSYSSVSSHGSMVYDEVRNDLYAEAIRNAVTPNSVVLDLGAGLGIHGLIAAAAGARRIYLVEPEPVVHIAMEVAKANGLADRMVALEDYVEDVELPEKVDVIVSVLVGNLLFSEDLLPSLFHARDKYLKPGGHLIPDRAELVVAPVSAPELHFGHIGRWSEPVMDFDLSAARRFAANEILWLRRTDLKCEKLAPGTTLVAIDFDTTETADSRVESRCRIEQSGVCHGLLCWIRLRLGDRWLSSDPAGPEVHWSPAVLPIDPPLQLNQGEEIQLTLNRPVRGDWTWSIKAPAGSRRHSSFLARADGHQNLRKLAPDYQTSLNRRGANVLQVLEMMRAGQSNLEIARALMKKAPSFYDSRQNALLLVQDIARRYGQ